MHKCDITATAASSSPQIRQSQICMYIFRFSRFRVASSASNKQQHQIIITNIFPLPTMKNGIHICLKIIQFVYYIQCVHV